ncbi:MAG: biopolymer transporter ExbD [Pirellulales bacterium]|nr:biopolymer transporter ExbD [Pirellulales bacterium]
MSIQFSCSQCGQAMRVDDRHAGAKVRCPRCGGLTVAPAAVERAAPAAKAPPPPSLDPDDEVEPVDFRKKDREEDELDMTPMVDVTFLLLIFFMVTAAFSLQKSLEIPAPDDDKTVTQQRIVDPEEGNVVVRIDKDSTVWIDESEAPSKQDLLVKLREARQGVPGSDSPPINSLLVMADGEARHEVVVMALDAGNAVGMEKVKLAIVDEDDF